MAEKNETAEAILIVIKRLAKWLLFGVLGLAGLIAVIWGGNLLYDYIRVDLPKLKVDVSFTINFDRCKDTKFHVLLTIKNRSNKTILHTSVYAEARRKGRSTDLAYPAPINIDQIIEPDITYAFCRRPRLEESVLGCDYLGKNCKYKYEDIVENLVWGVSSFTVRFK